MYDCMYFVSLCASQINVQATSPTRLFVYLFISLPFHKQPRELQHDKIGGTNAREMGKNALASEVVQAKTKSST